MSHLDELLIGYHGLPSTVHHLLIHFVVMKNIYFHLLIPFVVVENSTIESMYFSPVAQGLTALRISLSFLARFL